MPVDSNISRRDFIYRMAMFSTASLFGFGCGKKQQDASNVSFYGTATLDVGSDVWSFLEKKDNIRIRFKDNGNDAGPVIAQMTTGTAAIDYDLGGLLGGAENILASAGVILPWDLSKIPNWNDAWQWARDIKHTQWDNKQYGLPLVVNADSMIYLPDKIKTINGYESGVVDTYAAVFDPRLKGKTSMEDAWVNSVIFTAIYLKQNQIVQINEPGNLTESELKDVMTFLIDKKREGQFKKFWNGWEQGVELLRSGEVFVMTGWEPIVKALQDQGINAAYASPREGYEGWSIDLLLHVGARKHNVIEQCHTAANWMYAGKYGAALAALRGYAVPNSSSIKYAIDNQLPISQQVQNTVKHVQSKISKTLYWQNVRPDNYQLYEEWWSKMRSTGQL